MKRSRLAAAAAVALGAAAALTGPAASSPAPSAKAAAQVPVLTCGPTSTSGIWGCWNNPAGRYVLTFPADMNCWDEDVCSANWQGGIYDRWNLRYDPD